MFKRIAILAVAVVGAVGVLAAPASAGGYGPENGSSVSDVTPCPGGKTTLTGRIFKPGSSVIVTLDGATVGTPTADADGNITLEITIPTTAANGSHKLTATGQSAKENDDQLVLTNDLTVESCQAGPTTTVARPGAGSNLPRTGSDSTMVLLRAGFGLFALGGVLLAIAAKRRRNTVVA